MSDPASAEQDLPLRSTVAEQVRASLAKHVPREKLEEVVARLPAELQAKYRQQFQEPPVRYTVKIITRRGK